MASLGSRLGCSPSAPAARCSDSSWCRWTTRSPSPSPRYSRSAFTHNPPNSVAHDYKQSVKFSPNSAFYFSTDHLHTPNYTFPSSLAAKQTCFN